MQQDFDLGDGDVWYGYPDEHPYYDDAPVEWGDLPTVDGSNPTVEETPFTPPPAPPPSNPTNPGGGGNNFNSSNYPGIPNPSQYQSPDPLAPWTETFTAPTAEQALSSPGFQFRLGEGLKAIERSAAAKGTLLTGGTQKGLQGYGQDMASQEYGNVYNRAYNEYDTRRTNFLQNEANRYNSQRGNLQDQWGINSDYFDMGRANRLDDFSIWSGMDNSAFNQLLEWAKLSKPPSPYSYIGGV